MSRSSRTFLIALLTLAAGIGANWPAVQSFLEYWKGTELLSHTHAYVIAAISGWLIWRAAPEIEAAGSAPSWPFVILTALLSIASYLAWVSAAEVGIELLFPLILLSAVAGAVGLRAARAIGFGIGYLVFAVPVWGHFSVYLQSLSTRGVTALARITGLPAYVDGNTIQIPSGSLLIGGGCSGISYFIVALAIAALYGELNRNRPRHRVILLAVAAAMAVVMNWLRIYGIVLNAHLTDMKGYLVTVDHLKYGWVLFGILLVAFFWIARWLVPVVESVLEPSAEAATLRGQGVAGFFAVLASLAIGPSLSAIANKRMQAEASVTLTLPAGSGGWRGPIEVSPGWRPVYPQADVEVIGEYRYQDTPVAAYLNAYGYQAQGHELIGFGNDVLGDHGWQAETTRLASARAPGGDFSYVETIAITPSQERWAVGYVYAVGGRTFARSIASKVYYGVAALRGLPWSGVVAAASKCVVDCSRASVAVNRFMADNGRRLASGISELQAGT